MLRLSCKTSSSYENKIDDDKAYKRSIKIPKIDNISYIIYTFASTFKIW